MNKIAIPRKSHEKLIGIGKNTIGKIHTYIVEKLYVDGDGNYYLTGEVEQEIVGDVFECLPLPKGHVPFKEKVDCTIEEAKIWMKFSCDLEYRYEGDLEEK